MAVAKDALGLPDTFRCFPPPTLLFNRNLREAVETVG